MSATSIPIIAGLLNPEEPSLPALWPFVVELDGEKEGESVKYIVGTYGTVGVNVVGSSLIMGGCTIVGVLVEATVGTIGTGGPTPGTVGVEVGMKLGDTETGSDVG
jgi:hypothetical protein